MANHAAELPTGGLSQDATSIYGYDGFLRNLFVLSSLSFSFPLRKNTSAQNSPAFHEEIVRSGQEIGR